MTSPFAGKTPQERNKLIVAGVLGFISLIALYMAFGRGLMGGSSTTVTVKTTPSPTPRNSQTTTASNAPSMPSATDQSFVYQTTAIDYRPGMSAAGAPDPGRNIFAFYEPPPPCDPRVPGECPPPPTPKPSPTVVVPTPTPPPPPPIQFASVQPPSAFAGQKAVKVEIYGSQIPADAKVYFNQTAIPTTYGGAQRLTAEIPANMIMSPGNAQIILQNADGKLYSNTLPFQIVAPPKPQVQYIGMISRARHNNDTAYLINAAPNAGASSTQNAVPFGARLNDVVQSRFRLVEITPGEVTFEDTSLGFRHKVPINKTIVPTAGGPGGGNPSGFSPFPNQQVPQQITIGPDGIPMVNGVPISVPLPVPPNPNPTPQD